MTLGAFIVGLILFLVSILANIATRDKVHPAVIFPFVWAVSLVVISILPLIGFLSIEGESLLLFLGGGVTFSIVAIVTHYSLSYRVSPPKTTNIPRLNIKPLVVILFFTNLVVFYSAVISLMSFGSNISQVAYMVRRASVQGEQIFNPIVSNYMLLGLVLIPLLSAFLIKRQINLLPYLSITLPWATLILLASGRADLVQLMLVVFFIYYIIERKISIKSVFYGFASFLFIIIAGALAVNKVDVTSAQSFVDMIFLFVKHVASYAFQGPILFSQYYDHSAIVSPNWSPFRSIQHIFSLFNFISPPPFLHLEFNSYGHDESMVGNVYSLYFSLYPNNGLFGAFIILAGYSVASTYIYLRAKAGELVFILLSGYLFSAIILSIFSDYFLTGLWFFIKLVIIVVILKLFMRLNWRLSWLK
jgi:oligosaccharide repeat unit polymerase